MDFNRIKEKKLTAIYITSKNCNVCKTIFPKLEKLIENYRNCEFYRLDTDDDPKVSGEFMIFSVPGLIIYSEGKELYSAVRFIDLLEVESVLDRYYNFLF